MKTVDQVITRFRRHYPSCDATTALELFQTAYKRLLDKAEFRTSDTVFSAIVAATREYDWVEADNRVYGVTWYKTETDFWALDPTSEDVLTDNRAGWKDFKQLGTGIVVSSYTIASPTVLTTTAHGLTSANDGTRANEIHVSGLTGVPDGYYFAKITGYSTTTFGLYSDMALTTAVTASVNTLGTNPQIQLITVQTSDPCSFYIASRTDATSNHTGKLVIGFTPAPNTSTTNGYPYAVAHVATHTAISGATIIPYSLLDEMYFVYSMCEMWSLEEDLAKQPMWEKKANQERTIQIEHLKQLSVNSEETRLLPPIGAFHRSVC